MTTFDFSPLFRSTVGFDRLMRTLEESNRWAEGDNGYPPYNIEKTGEDKYRITLAIAGFSDQELSMEVHQNVLTIEGRKQGTPDPSNYLYRGIAGRSFKRQFRLADHVEVAEAHLQNGLLTVDLVREVPEAMKPRRIEISASPAAAIEAGDPNLIEKTEEAA
jgi:molecular chaperone IbpA